MWIVIESVKADFTCQRCFLLREYPAQDLGLGGGVLELPTTDSSQVQLVQVQVHPGQDVQEECELSLKADLEADITCSMFSPLRPLLVARYYPPQEFNHLLCFLAVGRATSTLGCLHVIPVLYGCLRKPSDVLRTRRVSRIP